MAVEPKIGGKPNHQNGWFIIYNGSKAELKMDDLGFSPYFWKHPYLNTCHSGNIMCALKMLFI